MRRPTRLAAAALAVLACAVPASADGDGESAAHADEAASPRVTLDTVMNGVHLRQYQLGCLSQLTYLVVSKGEAAVVDPQRDVEHYVRDAERLGAKVTTVLLTHTNADFVAGHTELAARGAKVYISGESGSKFAHEPLRDGQEVSVGAATITTWATPGHTLDTMVFLLRVPGAPVDPVAAFTGDTLFIGGIGRPDLVGGEATPMRLASAAYDSVQRLRKLPPATQVLPSHGAGSLCGAHLSPETVSTIGAELATNPYLAPMSRAQFTSRVISGLPAAPGYFRHNARINREGPPVLAGRPAKPPALPPSEVQSRASAGAWVIDLRPAEAYAAGHVEGSVNVAVRGRLDTWTGIVVPFEARLVLVGSEGEVDEAAFRFRRIGLDTVVGSLAGGFEAWKAAGLPVRTTEVWTPARLAEALRAGREPVLVDVRTETEFADVRLGDYANLPLAGDVDFAAVLDPKAPVLFVCNSSYRSSMAVGLAERQGFAALGNLEGGLDAWISAGLPTKGSAKIVSRPAAAEGAVLLLPEPISPAALATGLHDQPGAWAVLDLRPAWAFEEYHVPGATRVALGDLVERVRALPASVRVVLADRDGTAAHAAAGFLVARLPERAVRVLAGGTAAFWREVELAGNGPSGAETGATTPTPHAPAPEASPAPPAKKRPAGC